MTKNLVYLASPYSHPHHAIREQRFREVSRVAAKLMRLGHKVFCPISHSHPIAVFGETPTDFAFWREYDVACLDCCHSVYVLMLDGWQESLGVNSEVMYALAHDMPVYFIDEDCNTVDCWTKKE